MKFDDIVNIYGKTSKRKVVSKLSELGNKLFGNDKWDFINRYDSETITSNSGRSQYVVIGDRPLTRIFH